MSSPRTRRVRVAAAGLALAVTTLYACKNDTTNPTSGSIAVSVAASSVTVQQGQSANTTVTIVRSGGFTDVVNLTLDPGAPAGLTATFAPATIASGATTSTLTLAPSTSVAPGTYTVTVRAKGSGVSDAVAQLSVVVTQAPTGSFGLALSPNAVSVVQGSSATTTATITRAGGFSGDVALAVTGAPSGLTVTANPATLTGSNLTSTITVTAAASLAPQTVTLTVTGTGTGVQTQTATLTVQVTQATSPTATIAFCSDNAPIWLAEQDGTGPWTQLTAGANNTYTVQFTSGRGGVAYVTHTPSGATQLQVLYITSTELAAAGGTINVACVAATGKTLNGSVAGLASTDVAHIALGPAAAFVTGTGPSTFQLKNVPSGPRDLIAGRSAQTNGQVILNSLIIRRNLDLADQSSLPVLDFGSGEAFAPATANLTISNLGTDQAFAGVGLVTANGSNSFFYFDNGSGGATRPYYGVPDAQLVSGDFHELFVTTSNRSAIAFFHSVTDRTIALGAALSAPTITTVATTPYLMLRAQLPQQSDYNRMASVSYVQGTGASARNVIIAMTAGYAAAATGGVYDLVIPDLSGAAGFNTAWALQPGVSTNWSVDEVGGSFLLGFQRPTEGTAVVTASLSGTIASP